MAKKKMNGVLSDLFFVVNFLQSSACYFSFWLCYHPGEAGNVAEAFFFFFKAFTRSNNKKRTGTVWFKNKPQQSEWGRTEE